MRKFIALTIVTLMLSACGHKQIEPVMDLKADKNASEAQMDWMGCEWLANKYGLQDTATIKCLEGRGHSVIGVVER